MNLKQYIEKLQNIAKEDPKLLELDVIASKDDEGNGFNTIHYDPSLFYCEDGDMRESTSLAYAVEEWEVSGKYGDKPAATHICVN